MIFVSLGDLAGFLFFGICLQALPVWRTHWNRQVDRKKMGLATSVSLSTNLSDRISLVYMFMGQGQRNLFEEYTVLTSQRFDPSVGGMKRWSCFVIPALFFSEIRFWHSLFCTLKVSWHLSHWAKRISAYVFVGTLTSAIAGASFSKITSTVYVLEITINAPKIFLRFDLLELCQIQSNKTKTWA